jgi:hypothetical protein
MKIALSIIGVVFFICIVFAGGLLSFRSSAVNLEETIKAQYSQNQNNYDSMWKKFKEMSQVPEKYAADLKELYLSSISARYGESGSQAMFQWLQEKNPDLNVEVYSNLQLAIESGRNSFEANQKQLVAKKEQYAKLLRSNSALVYNAILHYPKIDLDKFSIITSEETDRAFEDKKAEKINIFE